MSGAKISILTPSLNQAKFIEEAVASVINQNYSNVEHIVIDGGSTDATLEILRKYKHLKVICEKDSGQSDALNKGLQFATGDIIGWLNADDYYEENIFADVVNEFEDAQVMWIVSNIMLKYELSQSLVPRRTPKITLATLLSSKNLICQQGSFYRKSLLQKAGGWDVTYHTCMDWELWIRLVKITEPKVIDKTWAYFRLHPDQKTNYRNLTKAIREWDRIYRREKVSLLRRWYIYARVFGQKYRHQMKIKLIDAGLLPENYRHAPLLKRKGTRV